MSFKFFFDWLTTHLLVLWSKRPSVVLPDLKIAQQAWVFIAFIMVLQLGVLIGLLRLVDQAESDIKKEYAASRMFAHTNWLSTVVSCANVLSLTQYVSNPQHNKDLADKYKSCKELFDPTFKELSGLFTQNKSAIELLEKANNRKKACFEMLDRIAVAEAPALRDDPIFADLQKTWVDFAWIRYKFLQVGKKQFGLTLESLPSHRAGWKNTVILVIVLNALIPLLLIPKFVGSITRRVELLAENSRRLARQEQLLEPIKGIDEISQLDASFHKMAADLTNALHELEASEERVRSIIRSMPVGLLTLGQNEEIEFTNPSAAEIFQFEESELQGKSLSFLLPGKKGASKKALDVVTKPEELQAKKNSGELVDIEVSFKALSSSPGERTLVVIQDITERQHLERMKHEFFAMVTHDLRSPLSSIQVSQELVHQHADSLPDSAKSGLEIARRSTARLLKLVNDFLDFEKVQAGKFEMTFSEVSVIELIARSVEGVQASADKAKVKIQVPTNDAQIEADGERIIQVLVNLLSNAVKFSPPDSTVVVNLKREPRFVKVEVKDQGKGIAPENLNVVFEKYKQVGESKAKEKGTGLGLPISKAFIEGHGGTIGVESVLGEGSTFWFRIPIYQNRHS